MSLYGDQLYTSRLTLAKITKEDLPAIVAWSRSDTACGRYLTPEQYTLEQIDSQIKSGVYWNDQEKMFLVRTKKEKKAIGTVHYWQSAGGRNTVTMALKVALPEERGKGYGTEIQKFLIMYIFDRLSVTCIEMYVDVNNSAQQRCLEKLGFELMESLSYDDQQEIRTGHLFRLTPAKYHSHPIYQFHCE